MRRLARTRNGTTRSTRNTRSASTLIRIAQIHPPAAAAIQRQMTAVTSAGSIRRNTTSITTTRQTAAAAAAAVMMTKIKAKSTTNENTKRTARGRVTEVDPGSRLPRNSS